MASGVKTNEACFHSFEKLKSKHSSKYCLFKLNPALTEVVLDKEMEDTPSSNKLHCYEAFLRSLPPNECRYGAFEYGGRIDHEGKRVEKILFVSWAPEGATMRQKMVHAASLSAVKEKLKVSDVVQATEMTDLSEECVCEKLRIKLDYEDLQKQKLANPYHDDDEGEH